MAQTKPTRARACLYGCEPILPAEPCPPGLMAVPGDEDCRPIMACGEGKWGDLPVDDTTQIELDGEPSGASGFELGDGGNNSCGCPVADGVCQVLSRGLEPPEPLGTE